MFVANQIDRLPETASITRIRKITVVSDVLRDVCPRLATKVRPLQAKTMKLRSEGVPLAQRQTVADFSWKHISDQS